MKVFVTRKLPLWEEVSRPLYDAGHEVVVSDGGGAIERDELIKKLSNGCDGLLCLLTDKIDEEVLHAAPNLKIVANYAVGYDNIDVEECRKRNILVTNTPSDKVNESVAEHAWALMLALTRRIVEANDFMRNAAYRGWEPDIFLGGDMAGKTLGIIGTGRIGNMVARRAEGFGMQIMGFSRSSGNLEEVLSKSDFVSLHVPLSSETRHLINGKTLALMKKSAFLINTARGGVVNETEVVEALRAGMLAGYGADVFENEPNPHPELLQMENVIMTPHIASATYAARRDMGDIAIKNMIEGLAGSAPTNLVK